MSSSATLPGVVFAALILAGSVSSQVGQSIVFDSETIRVTLLPNRVQVEGSYVFLNPNPGAVRQRLFYPFPLDSLHFYPDSIEVSGVSPAVDRIPHLVRDRGISFDVVAPASDTVTIDVYYEQSCSVNEACYILTTTAAWNRPLAHASFEVNVPESVELLSCTYDVGEPDQSDETQRYAFAYDDFMPVKDLCLTWRVR